MKKEIAETDLELVRKNYVKIIAQSNEKFSNLLSFRIVISEKVMV